MVVRGHFEIINYEKSGKFIKIKWKLCIEKIYRWLWKNHKYNWNTFYFKLQFQLVRNHSKRFIHCHTLLSVAAALMCGSRCELMRLYEKVLLADEWQWVGKCVVSFHNGPTPSDTYIGCSSSIYDHCICGRDRGKLIQITDEWVEIYISSLRWG